MKVFSHVFLASILLGILFDPTKAFSPVPRHFHGKRNINVAAVNGGITSSIESMGTKNDTLKEDEEVVRTEAIKTSTTASDRKMDLMFCDGELCKDAVRQRVIGKQNQIVLSGPATGQVAYRWDQESTTSSPQNGKRAETTISSVLLLVRSTDDEPLIKKVSETVPKLTNAGIKVLLVPDLAAKLKFHYGVDDDRIRLFEEDSAKRISRKTRYVDDSEEEWVNDMMLEPFPDLVCTIGGDGLLMHASKSNICKREIVSFVCTHDHICLYRPDVSRTRTSDNGNCGRITGFFDAFFRGGNGRCHSNRFGNGSGTQ